MLGQSVARPAGPTPLPALPVGEAVGKSPSAGCFPKKKPRLRRGFSMVAGAGFEPATLGL